MVDSTLTFSSIQGSRNILLDEEPKVDATRFFKLLKDPNELLWDGFTTYSKFSIIEQMFTIKSNYKLSEADYNWIVEQQKACY